MKGVLKNTLLVGLVATLMSACTTMKTIDVRETKAHPSWYADCEQIGSEGFLFWKTDYAYACGISTHWCIRSNIACADALATGNRINKVCLTQL